MEADISSIENGKMFRVKGRIDNSQGKTDIKSYRVVLREKLKKISDWQFTKVETNDIVLYNFER